MLSLTLDELYPHARFALCKFRGGTLEVVRRHFLTEDEARRAAILANRMSVDPTVTFRTVRIARSGKPPVDRRP